MNNIKKYTYLCAAFKYSKQFYKYSLFPDVFYPIETLASYFSCSIFAWNVNDCWIFTVLHQ